MDDLQVRCESHEVKWTDKKVSLFWDYISLNKGAEGLYFSKLVGKSVLRAVLKEVSLQNRRVLDYGCGKGFIIERLLQKKIFCEGADFSKDSLSFVDEKFKTNSFFKGIVSIIDGIIQSEDETYDAVFCIEVLEHVLQEHIFSTLSELYRVLKKGGHLVITVPNNEVLSEQNVICPDCGCIFHRWQHVRSFNKDGLISFMDGYGFKKVICKEVNFHSDMWLIRSLYDFLFRKRRFSLIYIGQKER